MLLADPRVDVNVCDKVCCTNLYFKVFFVLFFLLYYIAAIQKGDTPLYKACKYDNVQVVAALLADPRVEVNMCNLKVCYYLVHEYSSPTFLIQILSDN